ncbi:MAG: hypothetical protein KAU12_03360 [Candidatus Omnitrophica bacterium]|nr:hypothetical protein [Candidatus Omnitrophota bacterium]
MRKVVLLVFIIGGFVMVGATQVWAQEVYIDNFNTGSKPNALGGDSGVFDFQPTDFSQCCVDIYDSAEKHGDSGFSMRLNYDVDSADPAYNGYWSKLNGFDTTGHTKLVLWVKGDTTVFKIELKNNEGEKGEYYITGVTADWKKVEVPLENFEGLTNLSSLSEFVVVFEDRIASRKEGTIWIDDIYFSD